MAIDTQTSPKEDRRMPRPRRIAKEGSVQISIRANPNVVERADALIGHIEQQHPGGLGVVRSDVFRLALERGLRELELEKAARRMKR